jgi:hypothetical protein
VVTSSRKEAVRYKQCFDKYIAEQGEKPGDQKIHATRYCARAPFALERLRKAGGERVYRCAKQHSEPGSHPCARTATGISACWHPIRRTWLLSRW